MCKCELSGDSVLPFVQMMKLALRVFGHPWLRWRAHLNQNEVLDGDNVFLHMQVGSSAVSLTLRVLPQCAVVDSTGTSHAWSSK